MNFPKSSFIGLNTNHAFLDLACEFLHCKKETPPLEYLGLPIGANPSLAPTWEPLVNLIHRRLHSWKNRYMSLGGIEILINYVLNDILMFYLSFMKMPVKVWKKIVNI